MNKTDKKHSGLIAGAATTDITPLNSQFLFGYPHVERMSTGTNDPLLSSALYFSNGNGQAMMIANDVIFISKESTTRIRQEISRKTGIPAYCIMISATHTHSGPITVDCVHNSADPVVPKADKEYVRYMEEKITETACKAYQNAAPAKAAFVIADARGIGTNRHDPSGPADPQLPVMIFKDTNNEYIACTMVCNMHPTVLHEDSKLYSGDFPAYAREILQKQYLNCECPVLYMTGAAGNQSPRHVTKENTFNEARRLGGIIAKAVGEKIKNGMEFSTDIPVSVKQTFIDLPRRDFPAVDQAQKMQKEFKERFEFLKKTSKNRQEIRTAEVDWFGAEETLVLAEFAEKGGLEEYYKFTLPAEIQIINVGPWYFVAWPGEVFIEYEIELKQKNRQAFMITLANGELQGYVVTKEAGEKGFYEASNSILHYSAGNILLNETLKLLNKIK